MRNEVGEKTSRYRLYLESGLEQFKQKKIPELGNFGLKGAPVSGMIIFAKEPY